MRAKARSRRRPRRRLMSRNWSAPTSIRCSSPTRYPQEVRVSPAHRDLRGSGWTACVRALQLTSANGKPLGPKPTASRSPAASSSIAAVSRPRTPAHPKATSRSSALGAPSGGDKRSPSTGANDQQLVNITVQIELPQIQRYFPIFPVALIGSRARKRCSTHASQDPSRTGNGDVARDCEFGGGWSPSLHRDVAGARPPAEAASPDGDAFARSLRSTGTNGASLPSAPSSPTAIICPDGNWR